MSFGIRRWGLRTKIIAWTSVPIVIALITVSFFIYNSYERVTEDLVMEQNSDAARITSRQLEAELEGYVDIVFYETYTLGIIGNDPDVQRDTLKGAANRLAAFDAGTMILDTFGTVVATEPERPEILGQDWSDRDYYRQALRLKMQGSPEAAFSDIVPDGKDGVDVLCIAVPIIGEHEAFLGCLVGMFRMGETTESAFYGDLIELNLGENGDTYLVDANGKVIYHTDLSLVAGDFSTQNTVQRVLDGQSDAIRTKDSEGNEIIASYAPVSGTSWGLVTEESWGSLRDTTKRDRYILLSLLLLAVIVPIVIVAFGVRRITRPIGEVSSAAREIAAGNFSQRIVTKTGDELEELANQFNSMADALKESYATLEQKVEDRTRGEKRRAEQLRTVNEVGRSISSILQLDELFPHVVTSLRETFNYHNVGIVIIDRDSGSLMLKASAGAYEGGPDIGITAQTYQGIVSKVSQEGEPILVNDILNDPVYHDIEGRGDTRSELAVPIKLGSQILGVLDIESTQVDAFDELDLFTAQTLADQLAIAIENARLYQETRDVAIHEERNRLARDLHDAVSQTLFSASLIAEVIPKLWNKDPEEGKKRLEEVRQLTRGALAEMRTLLLELRPSALLEAELPHLLSQLAESIGSRTKAQVTVSVEGDCSFLPDEVKIALYRIAQEALNNVVKHSGASKVKVELNCLPDKVKLTINDDGLGFDISSLPADTLGLGIMRERAADIMASLSVKSSAGHGTEIMVIWDNLPGEDKL